LTKYNSTQQAVLHKRADLLTSALVHVSAIVSSDVTQLSNSTNNEQLFINLATVPADVILLFRLRKAASL
jgi:hypothetical protein